MTSEGYLALAGRDAQQNELLVKVRRRASQRVTFHIRMCVRVASRLLVKVHVREESQSNGLSRESSL